MSMQVGSVDSLTFSRNAMKYLQGQKLQEESTGKEIVKSLPTSAAFASAFQIIPAANKARKYKDLKNIIGADEFKKFWSGTVKDEGTLKQIAEYVDKKAIEKGEKTLAEKAAQKAAKEAAKGVVKEAAETTAKEATESTIKAATKSGEKALKKATSNIVKKSFLGEVKSFFLFSLAFQLTEIIPAFKNGGKNEGIKQTAKSAIHAAGDAVAFTAGMKLGAAAGTAVGGPIGTIVGGVLGMVLGGVASTLAEKGIKKIVGKNYSEKVAESQAETQAQALAQDGASMQELQTLVAQKIAEDQADGSISDDTKEMIKELNALQTNGTTSFGSTTNAAPATTNPYTNTVASDVNKDVRNNILSQQAQGYYDINNLPKTADGKFDHSMYKINLAA